MNRLITLMVSAVASAWMPLALAQAPVDRTAETAGDPAIERTHPVGMQDGERDALRRACVPETGSRIRRLDRDGRCLTGRSYDREDIRRTGEFDVGRALRKLDPSIY